MARVLVIDDEENILFSFRRFLEREGHDVDEAHGLDHVGAILDATPPDVVVADVLLGGEDGMHVIDLLRDRKLIAPVVLISGVPSVDAARRAFISGAFNYMAKPVTRDMLLHAVSMALRHRELEEEKNRLEQERESLRAHLSAIFRSVPDAIFMVCPDQTLCRINDAAGDLLGTPPENARRMSIAQFAEHGIGSVAEIVDKALRHKSEVRLRRVPLAGKGGARLSDVSVSPLYGDAGDFMGAVVVVRDVTRQVGEGHETDLGLIGASPPMMRLYRFIDDLSHTDTTVLITGESGTGKELVAEALHRTGLRSQGPLVKINCSALPETLLESELFGHVRGAFTGAVRDRQGRFQLAHGGTIFLDEIGDIAPAVQLKLLRVLQEREFERLGDTRTIRVDVRVIAATNRNLRELVDSGRFREDLYYRLRVVELRLPPLRERLGDMGDLQDHFVRVFNELFQRQVRGLTDDAQQALLSYSWPGNVRELRHAVEHGFILCRGDWIDVEALPPEMTRERLFGPPSQQERLSPVLLREALARVGGNKAKAARALGVSRQTVYRKLAEYGMESEA